MCILTASRSPAIARLPDYLAATNYINPGSHPETSTPFQFGNNTPLSFYQAMGVDPTVRNAFDGEMRKYVLLERSRYKTGFASIFDFEGIVGPLINSNEDVILVDVGGNRGHVLEDVIKHLPGLKGRLVLEDLPGAIQGVDLGDRIEAIPYDFLASEQPVKGLSPPLGE